jgi:drug/metabolite transporter (DMT)-like permease
MGDCFFKGCYEWLTQKKMNFIFPILAAVLQAGSFTVDKVVLSIRRVNFKTYTGISFPLIFVITLIIFLIFRPPLTAELFLGNLWLLIVISVVMMIITNLIFYRALDHDHLGEIQTLGLLHSIPIIIFSSIIFTDERNFFVLVPALIASFAIIWSHWERHHFKIAKHTLPFLVWSLGAAPLGAVIAKTLLAVWSPISLELIRSGAVAAILGSLFFKHARKVSIKAFYLLLVTNILTSVAWILFYFSYQRSGIVYTVLVFSLQPLLVYFASVFFLKEKLHWKKVIAFAVVLISIAAVQMIG